MGGVGQVIAGLMRCGNRWWGKEGGHLEDGRSGKLEESTRPGRREHGLETGTESKLEGWG